jgi:hypothetical protein
MDLKQQDVYQQQQQAIEQRRIEIMNQYQNLIQFNKGGSLKLEPQKFVLKSGLSSGRHRPVDSSIQSLEPN